jgi:hypothetical protein
MKINQMNNAVIPHLPGAKVYETSTGCRIIVNKEGGLWHLSISHPERNPTWEEIRDSRYELLPDGAHMAMILPPKSQYVNIHRFCFHLFELAVEENPTSANPAEPTLANDQIEGQISIFDKEEL